MVLSAGKVSRERVHPATVLSTRVAVEAAWTRASGGVPPFFRAKKYIPAAVAATRSRATARPALPKGNWPCAEGAVVLAGTDAVGFTERGELAAGTMGISAELWATPV